MTKPQLIDRVATAADRPKAEVETVVDSLLGEIGKVLQSGERVDLRGFGSFIVKDKKARQGRNPKTGETIQIAARKAATFKPSKELSDRLAADNLATTGQVQSQCQPLDDSRGSEPAYRAATVIERSLAC